MIQKCLNCKSTLIEKLENDIENKVPLSYKKKGNYSLLPKMLNCNPQFNPSNKDADIKEHTPEITDIKVEIPIQTKKNTWVFYWAALSNDDFKKIESQEVAYSDETNYGIIKTNEEGKVTLKLNCPQPYKIKNITYDFNKDFPN